MKLAVVHRPTSAPSQSRLPLRAWSTSPIGVLQHVGDVGRHGHEQGVDRVHPLLALAEQPRQRGGDDDEGEERKQRQISEVAGMDEAVRIDADRDPLDHLPGVGAVAGSAPGSCPDAPWPWRALAPGFRRFGGDVAHVRPKRRAPRAGSSCPCRPALEEAGELGIVGHFDHQGDELVAARAALGGEALALEPQHLARARPLGDAQHHRPVHGRHADLAAEHRLVDRDRQIEPDIVALAAEEAVRLDLDGDDRVAIAGRARPGPGRRGGSWCRPRRRAEA